MRSSEVVSCPGSILQYFEGSSSERLIPPTSHSMYAQKLAKIEVF